MIRSGFGWFGAGGAGEIRHNEARDVGTQRRSGEIKKTGRRDGADIKIKKERSGEGEGDGDTNTNTTQRLRTTERNHHKKTVRETSDSTSHREDGGPLL